MKDLIKQGIIKSACDLYSKRIKNKLLEIIIQMEKGYENIIKKKEEN